MDEIVTLYPQKLGGDLACMPSKSMSHRLAIGAILAGNSNVERIGLSEDIEATLSAMCALGFEHFELRGNTLRVGSVSRIHEPRVVDCSESGSTLRFLIPLGMDGEETRFTGRGRLMQRSMRIYEDISPAQRIVFQQQNDEIYVKGKLSYGLFPVRGDISSQFISGLLFALPMLRGDSVIQLSTHLESKAYVDLTIDALARFGVEIAWPTEQSIYIAGNQAYQPADVCVEGDFSHAAFWLVAGVLGRGSRVTNLRHDSLQGDRAILKILQQMGAKIETIPDGYQAYPSELHGCEIDVSQVPDLVPILSVAACAAQGTTRIYHAARLRDKECDRLAAMASELAALGADIEESEDELKIRGNPQKPLVGGACHGHRDHRVVMSLAIAASLCEKKIKISNAWSVKKSAPDFWNEYAEMGGRFEMKKERS